MKESWPVVAVVIAVLCSLAHTSPALASSLSTTTSSPTLMAAEKPIVDCFKATTRSSRVADTKSCLQAALQLPDYSDPGIFHNGDPPDAYKLPVVKKFGPCMATVSISNGKQDRTSWDHISSVASSIAAICSIGQYPMGNTGGVLYVGTNKNIRVTLEKFTGIILDDDSSLNVTATA